MTNDKYFWIGGIILFGALIFFGNFVIDFKNGLLGSLYAKLDVFFPSDKDGELARLRAENAILKSRLASAERASADILPELPEKNLISARVYSTYPFNTRNELVVEKGRLDGVMKDAAVVTKEGILIGFIGRVSEKTAAVKTVFDPSFEIPVRIGVSESDAFLRGGNTPLLTLIEKDAPVDVGDAVVSADQRFPYGLTVGLVKEIFDSSAESFKSAAIEIPYSVSKLRRIYIVNEKQ